MIKDFIMSFRENFREKTTNPFLGTYATVWVIRNWELVYTLFHFDDNYALQQKIDFINSYYHDKSFVAGLLFNILYTFGALIATYIVLNASRVIVNLSEKRLTPWIYLKTDSKSIVKKEVYELLRSERDDLQQRLDKERDSKSRLESQIKTLQEELLEERDKEVVQVEQPLFPDHSNSIEENEETNLKSDSSLTPQRKIYKRLEEKDLKDSFLKTVIQIQKRRFFGRDSENLLDPFLEFGLIEFDEKHTHVAANYYKLTDLGHKVLSIMRNIE